MFFFPFLYKSLGYLHSVLKSTDQQWEKTDAELARFGEMPLEAGQAAILPKSSVAQPGLRDACLPVGPWDDVPVDTWDAGEQHHTAWGFITFIARNGMC